MASAIEHAVVAEQCHVQTLENHTKFWLIEPGGVFAEETAAFTRLMNFLRASGSLALDEATARILAEYTAFRLWGVEQIQETSTRDFDIWASVEESGTEALGKFTNIMSEKA